MFGDGYEGSGIRPPTVLPRRANRDDNPKADHGRWPRNCWKNARHSIQPLIRLETGSVERDRDNNDISPHGKDSQMIVRPILEMLNEEQKHAHDIIESRIFGGESKVELSHTAVC